MVAVVALSVTVVVLAAFVVILARDARLGAGSQVGSGAGVAHAVVYGGTPGGVDFTPRRLVVGVGDRVVFVNDSGADFWPASNIHPTHEVLPAFDPLGAIPPGGSWGYTFTDAGEWRYHDHLAPDRGGVITVIPAGEDPSASGPIDEQSPPPIEAATGSSPAPADDLPDEQAPSATGAPTSSTTVAVAGLEPLSLELPETPFPPVPEDLAGLAGLDGIGFDDVRLRQFVTTYGPAAAVEALGRIIGGESECHQRAHVAGRMAFEVFGPAAFVLGSHGCQSGSLHGTIEALFAQRGTANLAGDVATLCSGEVNEFDLHNCLHGVGHGIMAWTNYELHEALRLCDAVPVDLKPEACYSGVFMENVVGGLSGAMGHYSDYLLADDPIYPCDVVAERYRPDCYFYQTSHMMRVLNYDVEAVARLCADAPQPSRLHCFGSLGRDVAAVVSDDPASAIAYCRYATTDDQETECLAGAVQNGFWDPSGAERAAEFCRLLSEAPETTEASRERCYQVITTRAQAVLPSGDALDRFCATLPTGHRTLCNPP